MLLTVYNLPANYRYSDVKALLFQKCGLTELILDNLVSEGATKKVTVGVADDGDAAVVVRKVNGVYVEGQQLYVEDARKKRPGSEQPFRSISKLSQAQSVNPLGAHYQQALASSMQLPPQPQYTDPQTYMVQPMPLDMQPYMNNQATMPHGYGMPTNVYMPTQDTPMLVYQGDSQPYNPVGPAAPASQPNWGEQTSDDWAKAAAEFRSRTDRDQGNWDADRSNDKPWARQRSRSRSPPRSRRNNRDQSPPAWEPRQDPSRGWYPRDRDSDADTAHRRPASPPRNRYDSQRQDGRREPSQNRGGDPDYRSRSGPRDEPSRRETFENPYLSSSQRCEPEDRGGSYRDRRRSRSPDRGRRFDGGPRGFHEPHPERKRPAERDDRFPKRARGDVEFDDQGNRSAPAAPSDESKPGDKIAPNDFIPLRDRTWRGQAASVIAKGNAPGEGGRVLKYYKRTVAYRLDKLMGKAVGVLPGEMVARYPSIGQGATNDSAAPVATEKPRTVSNYLATKPTHARIPIHPGGDKQNYKDMRQALWMESRGEMTYSLDAPEDQALESDLDNLTMIIKDECGAGGDEATPAEKYVAGKADAIVDELRTAVRLHVTKRILNVTNHLAVRINSQGEHLVDLDSMSAYLKRFGVTSLRKIMKGEGCLATINNFKSFDKLVQMKTATLRDGTAYTILPLHLLQSLPKRFHPGRGRGSNTDAGEDLEADTLDLDNLDMADFQTIDEIDLSGSLDGNGTEEENGHGGLKLSVEDFDADALDLANPDEDDLMDY